MTSSNYRDQTEARLDRVGRLVESAVDSGVGLDRLLMFLNIFNRRSHYYLRYNPAQVKAILRRADQGWFGEAILMYYKMRKSDPDLGAVTFKRDLVGRRTEQSIEPYDDSSQSEAVAEYVKEVFTNMAGVNDCIFDLMSGNYDGFAAQEIEWFKEGERWIPIAVHNTNPDDWRWHDGSGSSADITSELNIVDGYTGGTIGTTKGMGLLYRDLNGVWHPTPQDKFVIVTPDTKMQMSLRGQMRSVAGVWTTKQIIQIAWDSYVELCGIPKTIITVPDEWTGDKDSAKMKALIDGFSLMGQEGYAVISELIRYEIAGEAKDTQIHQRDLEYKQRQYSKAILGQTLTTDVTGSTGTLSTAEVHLEVENDIKEADLTVIEQALNDQLVEPIVRLGMGPEVPCPTLHLKLRNREREQAAVDRLDTAVNKLGIPVSLEWAYAETGIPKPDEGEETLRGEVVKTVSAEIPQPDEGENK